MARDIGGLRGGRGVGYGGVREARERAHATCRRYLTMRPVMHAPGPAPVAVRACSRGPMREYERVSRDVCVLLCPVVDVP